MAYRPKITSNAKARRRSGEDISLHTFVPRPLLKEIRKLSIDLDVPVGRLVTMGLEHVLNLERKEIRP